MNPSLERTIERHLAARVPDSVVALGASLRARFGTDAQEIGRAHV